MSERQAVVLIVIFLLFFYLALASLRIDSGDGEIIYQVARSLVEGEGFAIPLPSAEVVDPFGEPIPAEQLQGGGPYGAFGTDGRFYAQYGVGQSLLVSPLYLLGRWVYHLTGWGTEGFITRVFTTLLNPIVSALTGGVLYLLSRQLGYSQSAAIGTVLVVGLATPLWVYSKSFFSEPLIALLLTLAVLAALRGDKGREGAWVVCGTALGVAVLVKAVALVAAPALLLYAALRGEGRGRALILVMGPLTVGLAGVAIYNLTRFGSPIDTGYRTAAWNVPPWVGMTGLLLSPGKGLLWYCPPVVLGVAGNASLIHRRRRATMLLGGVAVSYLLAISTYNYWHGAGAWGPRLIMPTLPLLVLPVAEWFRRPPRRIWVQLPLAAILAAGVIIQIPAVLVHPGRYLQSLYDQAASPTAYTRRLLYRPADSPLLGQWRSFLEVASLMRTPEGREAVVETTRSAVEEQTSHQDSLTNAAGYLAFNTFDLYFVYWALLGVPPGLLLLAEGIPVALAGLAAWRLERGMA